MTTDMYDELSSFLDSVGITTEDFCQFIEDDRLNSNLIQKMKPNLVFITLGLAKLSHAYRTMNLCSKAIL